MQRTGFFTKIIFCSITFQSQSMVILPRGVLNRNNKQLTLDPGPVGALAEHVAIEDDPLESVAGVSHTVPDKNK
jgi:hypothetical protein